MKNYNKLNILIVTGIFLFFSCNSIFAQQKRNQPKNTQVFVDEDGDGYNDNAPDHDGDGIPNGLDPDWTKGNSRKMSYIDADGDGINDLLQTSNPMELQHENMYQNGSGESMMNNDQEKQMGHKKGQHNNK